jgi:hypothetical protein
MSTADDVNLYINWALNAVYGRLADADAIMRVASDAIVRVAAVLRKRIPIAAAPLYRGMLLDPTRPPDNASYTFVSWSEDVDVARWFGHPDAYISEPFREMFPEARGYVFTLDAGARSRATVLFHYSWAKAFDGLSRLALVHPFMGAEGERQIEWSLRTQREVITAPLPTLPAALPVDDVPGALITELDRRLAPPWTL